MKKNAEKLIAAIVVTTTGLSPVSYPVHAQEETEANVPRTMEHVNGQELLCNVRTDTTAENNAGDFNVTGGTSGTDWTYDSADRELTFLTGGTYTVTGDGQESPDRIVVAGAFDGTIVIRNNGKVTGYNKIAMAQGNTITLAVPVKEDLVDKNPVPKKTISVCEMNVEVTYRDAVELYEGVSLNVSSASYIAKVMAKSELVDVTAGETKDAVNPLSVFTAAADPEKAVIFLAGGSDGGKKGITDDVFMGVDGGPGKRTGLAAFKELNNVSIMAIPGVTSPAVQLALVAHCANTGASFAVLDVPQDLVKPQDVLAHREKIDSDYAAMYHPWIQIYDALNKKPAYIPPSGAVCGIYARTDNERGVHKAPANEIFRTALGLKYNLTDAEQELLNPKGINCIREFPGRGIRVWGARTISSNPEWRYINVRRLFCMVEQALQNGTNWVVFEPNTRDLWKKLTRNITAFLLNIWRSGALFGDTPEEAFYVRCDDELNPPESIDAGYVVCEIGLAPAKPAEFVVFRVSQKVMGEE